VRESARRDSERIRDRLANGDFRVGDRVTLRVEGEPDIPPVLPVEPGPRITLPVIGSLSLAGVLRSELQDHLTRELGRFIQDPVVQAKAEIRLSIQGGVGAPGFYTVPADILIGEALMLAGGPGQADLEELQIERSGQVLWEGDELQAVIAEGYTLDQLNLQAGDQIMLPVDEGEGLGIGWGDVLRWGVGIATSVIIAG
jgi:protein involved in polysaccharide export with SLBB domain